jgi:predicted transcriptional regulator
MTKEMLRRLFEQVEVWPAAAQQDLAAVVREIESELKAGPYRATADELEGIDRGLRDAAEGRFATPEQVEAVFAKYRRT